MRPRAAAPNLVGIFCASPLCDMLFYSSQLLMHRSTRCRVEPWLKLSFKNRTPRFRKLAPLVSGNRNGLELCASA